MVVKIMINVYKNIRRQEVDSIFLKRDKVMDSINFYKNKLDTNTVSESDIVYYKKRLEELQEEYELYDKSARDLIKEIDEKASKL